MIFRYLNSEGETIAMTPDKERCELLSSELVRVDGRQFPYAVTSTSEEMQIWWKGQVYTIGLPSHSRRKSRGTSVGEEGRNLLAQMPGTILKILTAVGDKVTKRQPLVLMESMKMEMTLESPADGTVSKLYYQSGDRVDRGALLLQIDSLPIAESP